MNASNKEAVIIEALKLDNQTRYVNIELGWPCYACAWNNRDENQAPCWNCKNAWPAQDNDYFEPILDPK